MKTAAKLLNIDLNVHLVTNYPGTHFKKDGGILNTWNKNAPKKRGDLFSRITGISVHGFSFLKIVYGLTESSGCKLTLSVHNFKIVILKL